MKIAHVGTSNEPVTSTRGGALQRRIMALAKLQADDGHDVVVFSPGDRDATERRGGVAIEQIALKRRRPARDYEFLAHVRRRLRARLGDVPLVLHAHGSPDAARMLAGSGIRAVQSVDYFRYRLTRYGAGRSYYRAGLNRFRAVLPVSEYCAAELARFYGSLRTPVRVIYNGVDLDQFAPAPERAAAARDALRLPPAPLVLYVGRICEQKGSDLLAPLARRLRAEGGNAVVAAVGPAEEFGNRESSDLIRALEASGVLCPGPVEEEHLAGLLNAATVFVLPTRRDEMFGMAALEALACGAPVVASHLGGIPEATDGGARLVPPGDAAQLSAAVLELLDREDLRRMLSTRGVAHASQFSWRRIAAELEPVYREALNG